MDELQQLCEDAQRKLIATEYLDAIDLLLRAELIASERGDFDTLGRLYMPLQEARRQRRQRCGEGLVVLDLFDETDAESISEKYPHGQLLVADEADLSQAIQLRQIQKRKRQFAETFLGATYRIGESRAVLVVPTEDVAIPPPTRVKTIDDLARQMPPHSVIFHENELPRGAASGTPQTFAWTMALWERLHLPFLAMADSTPSPRQRIAEYRLTIEVDDACEKAHQHFSDACREIVRGG